MEHNHSSIKDRILGKINAGEVSMRPKFHFTLKLLALVLLMAGILFFSVFLFNFILFSIRINSHDALLGFGPRGFEAFLFFFPWPIFLADVLLIALLERLLRQFRFGYKVPVLYLLLGLFALTIASAFAFDRGTSVNDRLLHHADRNELYFAGPVFEAARRPLPGSGVCKCSILEVHGSTLIVEDTRSMPPVPLTVMLPPDSARATTTGLEPGDVVFIAGDVDGGTIRAFGVRKLLIR
ncbi:MAG TPA: hypothetical protein VHD37_02065 [Candidatus Paceibacterota bacterium]|nr:hypothetical protein [Candidatus Paceibacterota bacterium]